MVWVQVVTSQPEDDITDFSINGCHEIDAMNLYMCLKHNGIWLVCSDFSKLERWEFFGADVMGIMAWMICSIFLLRQCRLTVQDNGYE